MMSRITNHKVAVSFSIIGLIIIIISAYFTFKEDSPVARSYFIDEYERINLTTNEERVTQPSMITPSQTSKIVIDAKNVQKVDVQIGDSVTVGDTIATYKTTDNSQKTLLQQNVAAYENELSTLKTTLSDLKKENTSLSMPNSYIDANQTEELLNIQIDLQLQQQITLADAISAIESKIAEVTRNIEIIRAQLANADISNAELSNLDGTIANIEASNDNFIFTIYSNEKTVTSFINENTWHQLLEGQPTNIYIQNKEITSGIVSKKSTIVIDENSIWTKEFNKLHPFANESYYEITVTPDDQLFEYPYATNATSSFLLQEVPNSYRIKTNWITKKAIAGKTPEETINVNEHFYLDDFGKVRTIDGETYFEDGSYTTMTSPLEQNLLLLNRTPKLNGERAIFSLPFETPNKDLLKAMDWKAYVKGLIGEY